MTSCLPTTAQSGGNKKRRFPSLLLLRVGGLLTLSSPSKAIQI